MTTRNFYIFGIIWFRSCVWAMRNNIKFINAWFPLRWLLRLISIICARCFPQKYETLLLYNETCVSENIHKAVKIFWAFSFYFLSNATSFHIDVTRNTTFPQEWSIVKKKVRRRACRVGSRDMLYVFPGRCGRLSLAYCIVRLLISSILWKNILKNH